MTHSPSDDRIVEYITGRVHGDDAASVREQLEESPGLAGAVEGLRTVMQEALLATAVPEIAASRARLLSRIDASQERDFGRPVLGRWTLGALSRSRLKNFSLMTVASAVMLVAIGVVLPRIARHPSPAARIYATGAGEQMRVTLPDGSRMTLAALSHVSVPAGFGSTVRAIDLDGQALLDVQPGRVPFVVRTGAITTRVLGTTFVIRHYANDLETRVVVITGKVAVSGHRTLVVERGQIAIVTDSTARSALVNNISDYTAWTTGRLVFHDTPAREAAAELSRAYGVDIRIPDSTLAAMPLTWTIPVAHQSLPGVLESLVDVLDAHSVRSGRIIILVPGRASSRKPSEPAKSSLLESHYGK